MNKKRADAGLPNGWALASVHDVGAVRLGRQRSSARLTGFDGTKYLRAANIVETGLDLEDVLEMDFSPEERERYLLQNGDVVLAEASGSGAKVGRPALWSGEIEECCYQNTVIRFRPHATEPGYALLVFRHLAASGVFQDTARGLGIQHLGARRFSRLEFPLPPAEEQARIVSQSQQRLDSLDNAKNFLLLALAKVREQEREIYAAASLGRLGNRDFSQSTDTAGDRWRAPISVSGSLLSGETNELGPLPEGWSWSSISALGSVRPGITRSPKRGAGRQPTKYLRSANISENGLDLSDVMTMDIEPSERERFDLRPGDVLVVEASGSSHQVGRSAVWHGELDNCSYQNHILRFRPKAIDPEYLNLVFTHFRHSGVFANRSRGVGIQHLSMKRFSSMSVPLPPRREQKRIVAEAIDRLTASRSQANTIHQSLSRIALMESEIVASAVSGTLVPQRPDVEPASELLRRLGPPPEGRPPAKRGKRMSRTRRSAPDTDSAHNELLDLQSALQNAGRPVGLEELFLLAGYDRNSPEQVEAFYLELRRELGRKLHIGANVKCDLSVSGLRISRTFAILVCVLTATRPIQFWWAKTVQENRTSSRR